MSFLSRIAMRAMGDAGDAPEIMPKDRGIAAMRAAAPEAEMPQDGPEAEAPMARSMIHRDPRDPVPEPEAEPREEDATGPVQAARRAEAEPGAGAEPPEEEPAARRAVRRAGRAEDEEEREGEDAPAARALAPETDEPPVPQDEPPETRNEKVPGRVLASRASAVAGNAVPAAMGQQAMPGMLDGSLTSAPGVAGSDAMSADGGEDGPYAAPIDSWDGATDDTASTAEQPVIYHGSAAAPRPAASGVVIEQIDVFVQEPAAREASRPRLSDPSRRVAARYLGGL